MSQTTYPVRAKTPELVKSTYAGIGTGAAALTAIITDGVVCTWSATGVYILTFAENNGTFIGLTYGLGATTASTVKGYTVSYGLYNTTTRAITINVWNSSFAAADLAALQYLTLEFSFRQSATGSTP
jgi:hypothetical protein